MTLLELASRFIGEVHEAPGAAHSPFIQWCPESCSMSGETPDEVPWCSSFINRLCWLLRLPRSGSASARSWLAVGTAVDLKDARSGDIIIMRRGPDPQPGPGILHAPGHVGIFAGFPTTGSFIRVLGGNQADGVNIKGFPEDAILGVRRPV